jgi:phosphatidylinositol kinase/protein kinase (PI-3  family)
VDVISYINKRKKNNQRDELSPDEKNDLIERKLKVFYKNEILPLSVEGKVQKLINIATSPDNLSKMYFWWMPFL